MKDGANIRDLIGQDLGRFKIVEMTEVYRIDDSGRKSKLLGFFKDATIAAAFAGSQNDANWHRTAPALVLTDGQIGYVQIQLEPVKIFDDEKEVIKIKEKVLEKLSGPERAILGFAK